MTKLISCTKAVFYVSQNSSDGDGSCFEMYAKTAGWMNLQSGKIALAGTANPTLTFDYSAGGAVPLTVSIITPNDVKDIATLTAGSQFRSGNNLFG